MVCRGLGLNLHYTRGESIDVSVVVESIFGGGNSNSLEIQINKELKVILDSFAAKINKSKGQTRMTLNKVGASSKQSVQQKRALQVE